MSRVGGISVGHIPAHRGEHVRRKALDLREHGWFDLLPKQRSEPDAVRHNSPQGPFVRTFTSKNGTLALRFS